YVPLARTINGKALTANITLTNADIGSEPAFAKNTAFNKNFGTASGTVAQGNDSRINNGQTAYGWGNHASAGYVIGGTGSTQVRNNSQLDARYVQQTRTINGKALSANVTLTAADVSAMP